MVVGTGNGIEIGKLVECLSEQHAAEFNAGPGGIADNLHPCSACLTGCLNKALGPGIGAPVFLHACAQECQAAAPSTDQVFGSGPANLFVGEANGHVDGLAAEFPDLDDGGTSACQDLARARAMGLTGQHNRGWRPRKRRADEVFLLAITIFAMTQHDLKPFLAQFELHGGDRFGKEGVTHRGNDNADGTRRGCGQSTRHQVRDIAQLFYGIIDGPACRRGYRLRPSEEERNGRG